MYTPQAADNVRISRTDHAASLQTPGTRRSSKGDGCDGCCKPSAHAERAKWTMDEATTVRRMACSAPPPTPLHPQPPRPAPQIFVSIVSYRDPECARTGESNRESRSTRHARLLPDACWRMHATPR